MRDRPKCFDFMRLLICTFLMAGLGVHAHPGHSPFEESLGHNLTSVHHLPPLLAFGVALFLSARLVKQRRYTLYLRCLGAVVVGAGAVNWLLVR